MKQLQLVIEVLQRGPTTSPEVARQTGLPLANASHNLRETYLAGLTTRTKVGEAYRYTMQAPPA